MRLSFQEMYNAIGKKESTYEGVFVTAVKSTQIFCRPSCRARKPLAKNVTFYRDAQEALRNGYRPCKVCRPMEPEGDSPRIIRELIREVHGAPFEKITDAGLRSRGLEPATIRRWFNRHHQMTFHAYQRLIRIGMGFEKIKRGESVTRTAFESGYDSLSGFGEGFKSVFGEAPRDAKGQNLIRIERFSTPLGPMFVAATERGVCLLEFTDRRMLENEFKDLRRRLNAVFVPGVNSHIRQAKRELKEYFKKERRRFEVALDTPGTDFQLQVWKELKRIPYGKLRTYREQAQAIGRPEAVRAVARANGMNRVAILIPCHRVIGSDGHLTGYAGGLPRKQALLELEGGLSRTR